LGGSRATPFLSAALFAKQKTKFGGGDPRSRTLRVRYGARSEGGAGIHFPPTPFLFARPSANLFQNSASGFSRKKVRISFSIRTLAGLDLVFCDPPFPWFTKQRELLAELLRLASAALGPDGIVLIRGERGEELPEHALRESERREYGRSWVALLRCQESP
jgi:hypothetical protein